MKREAPVEWHDANQRYLAAEMNGIRAALERHAAQARAGAEPVEEVGEEPPGEAPDRLSPPPAIVTLAEAFRLSPFERATLVLCAGVELDARFGAACAAAQGDDQRPYPTFSLALAALPGAHWSALTPSSPLRRWRLLEVGEGGSLTLAPLRIDERVLHYLSGLNHIDERLSALVDPAPPAADLVPTHATVADQVVAAWSQTAAGSPPPAIQLCGGDTSGMRSIASAACASVGLGLGIVPAEALPTVQAEIETTLRLWEREAVLNRCALMIDCEELDHTDAARAAAVTRIAERLFGVVILSTRERRRLPQRTLVTFDVKKPTVSEQRTLWRAALGETASGLNGALEHLAAQFDVSAQTIRAAAVEAMARVGAARSAPGNGAKPEPEPGPVAGAVWEACRVQARPRLDDLAQRIESPVSWDDLILPETQRRILREIAAHVRQRCTVYEKWGFMARGERGLGISALFAGVSGTGKTMAAEVIANDLHLDLYRIDLSATVSKYIGETEKNLSRVFDAAEEGGAVLLFDEADALFGKRSEVKDSHDRYANIEVSYLLQRMESYRGLAILTTNLKSALDTAFLRRIRFVVQFPFPDAPHRAQIWQRIFPSATPTEGLDAQKLAQLIVAGGHIRNTALNAAFIAADAGEPVRMRHILQAAQSEYAKLEKTLTEAEVAGWVDG